jgi:glycosyltransferase involved in cell wall biosynthesis
MAPINCYTGYGITSFNIIQKLYDIDSKISLFPIGAPQLEPIWDQTKIKSAINYGINFSNNKPCLKIWHANDLFQSIAKSSKYVGLTFFEIDKVSHLEKINYNLLDNIIVASQWAKDILLKNDISIPIDVCPMGVDTDIFDHTITHPEKDNNKYVFLNIGKWEIRKGHDTMLEIFTKAFNKDDNVELWMLNHNPFLQNSEVLENAKPFEQSSMRDKIRFLPRLPTQKLLASLISAADCGFFPARAEGWNNEAIEMMAMNKPIIITNYSAHTEYCNNDNSYLINISETEPANDGKWFLGNGNWAKIGEEQKEQAIEHMRYLYRNNIRTNPNGLATAKSLSWEKTAQQIYKIMYA